MNFVLVHHGSDTLAFQAVVRMSSSEGERKQKML